MSRLQAFRGFLTEKFTTVAVEIFGEVETLVETYYEENKRLRTVLQMVLNPEIKLSKIDVSQYTGATANVREQTPQLNTWVQLEGAEPLPKKPKEEQIECEINSEADKLFTPECVKTELEEEDKINMPCIINSFHIGAADINPDSSFNEVNYGHKGVSMDYDAVAGRLYPCRSEGNATETNESQKDIESPKRKLKHLATKQKQRKSCLQKTKLELPRMMPDKSLISLPDCQSFLTRLTEAFKDLPDDRKPLITKMDLTSDVELVDCAFGKVPKGSPLSYQCPLPSSRDYRSHDDAPPQPLLPLSEHMLEPVSAFPPLSAREEEHMNVMQITWDEAHRLEHSTRKRKGHVEDLRRLRLTTRFREICTLKQGRSHAKQLIFKLQKGANYKAAKIEEEMKAEALREYCENLCVNWSPCGLVVHPNAPWLGVLPDGVVYDPKENPSYGLVHIKCINVQSFTEGCLLVCQNGVVQAKTNHSCYWHIQAEMMVTGTSWCDLFFFSKKDLLVQRIYRDSAIINVMKGKLHDFFFCHYLPALVSD